MSSISLSLLARFKLAGPLGLLKEDPFALAMFFGLLLLGGDRIAITAGGFTLRIVFPVLMAAFFFLYKQREGKIAFDKPYTALFTALSVAGAISILNSLAPTRSLGYTIWILFDFFIIISLAYNFARLYKPDTVLSLWLWVFRIHGLLILASLPHAVATGDRPTLWFYETSYLAVFMTAYFGASLFLLLRRGRYYGWDLALSILSMVALGSATAMAGLLLCLFLNLILARQRVKLAIVSVAALGCFMVIMSQFFSDTLYYRLVVGFLLKPELSLDPILARAGNRWIRVLVGIDAFRHSPWTGIGIGGDAAYMEQRAFPESAWALVTPWSRLDIGQPFCNIVVEVLGCMGITGLFPFVAILLRAGWQLIRALTIQSDDGDVAGAFFVGFFSIFFALQLEGTFLRYYLWAPLGLGAGIMVQMRAKLAQSDTAQVLKGSAHAR